MSIKYNGENALTYLVTLIKNALTGKVDKVDGKGLSTNDLTATLKSNYDKAYTHSQSAHAPTNAQANVIESVKVDGTALAVTSKAVNIDLSGKVDKVSGKDLSTNDLTDTLKTNYDNAYTHSKSTHAPTNAQANVIETIKVNGSALTPTDKAVNIDLSGYSKTSHTHTKSDIGLGNVTNDAQVKRSEMGVANGVATLGSDGKVPSSQLPSYVDDVLEYTSKSSFPATGETGKIYVDTTTNLQYRWGGSSYVEISKSLALGETSSTAYAGNKGKANADNIAKIINGTQSVGNALKVSGFTVGCNVPANAKFTDTTYDLSGYLKNTDVVEMTNTEVQSIWDSVFNA